MDKKTGVLKRGLAAGAAAFAVGVAMIPSVAVLVWTDEPVGLEYLYHALGAYLLSHVPYIPTGDFFPFAGEFSLSASTAFYTLPAAVLLISGYLVGRSSSSGSTTPPWLIAGSVTVGYLGSFIVGLVVVSAAYRPTGLDLEETAVFLILPSVVYALIFGAIGGWLSHRMEYGEAGLLDMHLKEVRNLALVVAVLSLVVASAITVAPERQMVNTNPTPGVSFDVDSSEKEVSLSVVSMGYADYIVLVGDHTLEGDPVLNESGQTVVLPEEHLNKSGSLTAVGVIGEVEMGRDEGYTVAVEVDEGATETALQTESWDFLGVPRYPSEER